ncbi:MAG TPA: hypothetical protein VFV52_06070 [Bacilli bacterium]|nr:hypothetical protein [Bacilli bacterium]
MSDFGDLEIFCNKFLNKIYSLDELLQTLSYFPVPEGLTEHLAQIEYQLEVIRFSVSDTEQYDEAARVINDLIRQLKGRL